MPLGLAVQPARWTRRLPSSMKKSTYRRPSQSVSTVKKSHAIIDCACARRNSPAEPSPRTGGRHVGLAQDLGHGRRRDPHAHTGQLTDDPQSPALAVAGNFELMRGGNQSLRVNWPRSALSRG